MLYCGSVIRLIPFPAEFEELTETDYMQAASEKHKSQCARAITREEALQ